MLQHPVGYGGGVIIVDSLMEDYFAQLLVFKLPRSSSTNNSVKSTNGGHILNALAQDIFLLFGNYCVIVSCYAFYFVSITT